MVISGRMAVAAAGADDWLSMRSSLCDAFDLARAAGVVEERLEWVAEPEDHEEPFAWGGLEPVVGSAVRGPWVRGWLEAPRGCHAWLGE